MEQKQLDLVAVSDMPQPYGLMASMLQDATREWRRHLGRISPDGLIWQPFPGGHSVGAVLLHMADVESYWIEEFCLGRTLDPAEQAELLSKETNQKSVRWPTPQKRPLAYYYALQDRVRVRTLRHLTNFPDPSSNKQWGHLLVSFGWVVNHIVGHESYHGGQAVLLKELFRRRGR